MLLTVYCWFWDLMIHNGCSVVINFALIMRISRTHFHFDTEYWWKLNLLAEILDTAGGPWSACGSQSTSTVAILGRSHCCQGHPRVSHLGWAVSSSSHTSSWFWALSPVLESRGPSRTQGADWTLHVAGIHGQHPRASMPAAIAESQRTWLSEPWNYIRGWGLFLF